MICDTCALKGECQGPKDIQAVKALTWRSAIPASICYAIDEALNNFSNCEYYEEESLDKSTNV